MKTVHEVAQLAGVSVRTLRHYDKIGLLRPAARTQAGYRLYGDADLERLQQILLFRELEFPLKDIKRILDSPGFNHERALDQQIELLELKREHLGNLIGLARQLKEEGGAAMDFKAFDTSKMDEYARRAKESWGDTPEWSDYERRNAGRTAGENQALGDELMALFAPFGRMAREGADPAGEQARSQAKLIQDFISEHYYACSNEVFAQLGQAYGSGGEFTRNIDAAAGAGAADFAARAVAAYVAR